MTVEILYTKQKLLLGRSQEVWLMERGRHTAITYAFPTARQLSISLCFVLDYGDSQHRCPVSQASCRRRLLWPLQKPQV